MYRKYIKRLLDIVLALIAVPLLLVLVIILSPLIWLSDWGPVFYCSKRRGRYGKVFDMYKFRTMYVGAPDIRNSDNSTFSSKDDPRVTKIGRFLRETSLDEVPQIINILKGDMSWIGPRPPIPIPGNTWEDLNEKQKLRLTVRPGITGYNQAYFRNSQNRDERWDNDCYYVKNMSFLFDCKIVIKTLETVIKRKNLYSTSRIPE